MKKLLVASIAILSCAIGVFIGSVVLCSAPCKQVQKESAEIVPPPPPGMHGEDMHEGKGHRHGEKFRNKMHPSPEVIDSILQVTPEQKKQIEEFRRAAASTNKELFAEKMAAEVALRKALENETYDTVAINNAKKQLLIAQEKLLDSRIAGPAFFSKVLSKEQHEKFKAYMKENAPRGPWHKKQEEK